MTCQNVHHMVLYHVVNIWVLLQGTRRRASEHFGELKVAQSQLKILPLPTAKVGFVSEIKRKTQVFILYFSQLALPLQFV